MKCFFGFLVLCVLTFSCNNNGPEPKRILDGGGCLYREQSAIYTVDSLEIIDDTIRTVFFISEDLENNEPLITTISRNTIMIELYNDSDGLHLAVDSILNSPSKFLIKERHIEKGACSPYSLDHFELLK